MWESCLSGSERDWGATRTMGKIAWHRRVTRRQTENTNFTLKSEESPVYSKRGAQPGVWRKGCHYPLCCA